MKSESKFNIYAARLFLSGYGILFLYSIINMAKIGNDWITVTLTITLLFSSLIGGIVSIFLAKCLINQGTNKSLLKISIIGAFFSCISIPLLIFVIVYTVPRFFSNRKYMNKLWFVPSIITIITTITSFVMLYSMEVNITLLLFIPNIIFSVAQGFLCKWLISNPYDLKEPDTAKPISKKTLIIIGVIILFLLSLFGSLGSKESGNNAFQKDPNSWSDRDKEQVNDFFEWHHDYYD